MNKRFEDKIKEISKSLNELDLIFPISFESYCDYKTKAACERYFEKIIESVIDLSFILIKINNLPIPFDELSSFEILSNHEIISDLLCNKLKNAKGMRNRIVHNYDNVNDDLVFESIKEHLFDDINEFLVQIDLFLKR